MEDKKQEIVNLINSIEREDVIEYIAEYLKEIVPK